MTSLTLKSYQQAALDTLTAFARAASVKGPAMAFVELVGHSYNADAFGREVPCVCLRIPTGGGKTVMAAHAVPLLAREWRRADKPVAIWLVPSDAIRNQTLGALQTAGHPYREALAESYGADLQVCALEDVALVAPQDWGRNAIVLVATIQSFRIEEAAQRNVYRFSENFEPHFRAAQAHEDGRALQALQTLPDAVVTQDDADADTTGVLRGFVGQPRWSLANWLALQRPIVIVDEAHNTKTDKSFTALRRLNPTFILELTATPIAHKTNVLYHVSAQELAAENMIKLPIVLAEHPEGWRQAVFGAVQTRQKLEAEALKDDVGGQAYLRPLVLFQAQNANDEMPPEKLRRYLIDELKIDGREIVVATGETRELEGLDLAARSCPVRHVITVQALREGWDCPFAYVLCSLQKLTSATAVEQLLGRVLRMPYAQRHGREALNRAYAHVCAAEFSAAAHALADRLINHMGFEALDVASMIAAPGSLPLFAGNDPSNAALAQYSSAVVATNFDSVLPTADLLAVPGVAVRSIAGTEQIVVAGHIDAKTEELMLSQLKSAKKQQQVQEQVAQHNALVAAQLAPAARGAAFAPLPSLAYRINAQAPLWPLEREAVLEAVELDLLSPLAVQLPSFHAAAESDLFEIGVEGGSVTWRLADADQMPMDYGSSGIDAETLVRWLDQSLYRGELNGLTQAQRRAYLAAVVSHQLNACQVSLVRLAQARFELARRIEERVADLREAAARNSFTQLVLRQGEPGAWLVEPDWAHPHVFEPNRYPAPVASRYGGRYRFGKHYFPVIAGLKDAGEEFACAQQIDAHPKVRHWVRNLATAPCGFSLPTSRGRTYPDFVAELMDGRIAVLEYKGEHLKTDPYEIEKREIGRVWGQASGGRALYGWLLKQKDGLGVAQQLDVLLS